MTTEEQLALLEELERYDPAPRPVLPGDLTAQIVASHFGMGLAAARSWLARQVKAGRLVSIPALNVTGNRVKVFRKVE